MASTLLGKRFGDWRIERSGLRHTGHDYLIPRAQLWDGEMSGEPLHNDWEYHLRGRRWVVASDLRAGLEAARQYHAKHAPACVKTAEGR